MWIFAAAMALMLAPAEWLAMPMPEGFVTVHQQSAQIGSIEERVPKGETVERWTRMITLITLNGDVDPGVYADGFDKGLARGCPGAKSWPRTASRIGAHAAIDGRLDCPRNPDTGKPETLFYRLTGMPGHLHMVQIAFRSLPDAQSVAWAQARIGSATLCAPGSDDPACVR